MFMPSIPRQIGNPRPTPAPQPNMGLAALAAQQGMAPLPEMQQMASMSATSPMMQRPPMPADYGAGAINPEAGYNFGFAGGGMASLPEYKAGGKLLKGPGDGMSDSIPAVIRGQGVQRAALADGEFVIPADVVSHLGNGSTEAGAKKLYKMMDQIRRARTGNGRQAPRINPDKYLPRP